MQLTNRPLFLRDFYDRGLYVYGCFEYYNPNYAPGYILSSTLDKEAQQVFSFAREYHDIDHVITITKKNKESWEFYHFGGPRNQLSLPNFYLSNIDLLERFILYFHEKAEKLITRADKQRIIHPTMLNVDGSKKIVLSVVAINQHDGVRQRFVAQLSMKKLSLIDCNQKVVLTKRETDCLRELFKGYPAREIGEKLSISVRTVETHIVHVKDKLQCDSKSQLIDKLRQNNFMFLI